MTLLLEGGNIFKDAEGKPVTVRVAKSDVLPTVQWLEGITNLELTDNMLGTTGKKDTSGGIIRTDGLREQTHPNRTDAYNH